MVKLSATIITFNEKENILKCLSSIKSLVDEIIIVDSGSEDGTQGIAKNFGAKVFFRKFDNYAAQKNYAIHKASGEWVLSLDADEIIPKELSSEIKEAIQSNEFKAYLIPRRNFILGHEIKYSRWSPDKHIWLWKKDLGKWKGLVHEEVIVNGEIGEFKNAKIHYQEETVGEFIKILNRYTELEAEDKVSKGIKFSYFRMFFDPASSFLGRYFYKLGFLDRWEGFVLSYLMAIYRMTTWIKVWERQK